MPAYLTLTTTRQTHPDMVALLVAVKAATSDATAVLFFEGAGRWQGKKAAAWSAGDISAVQTALDTTAALTPQIAGQRAVDSFPIEYRALVLALVDAVNVLRTHAAIGLPAITPAQALASIRTKAGTL